MTPTPTRFAASAVALLMMLVGCEQQSGQSSDAAPAPDSTAHADTPAPAGGSTVSAAGLTFTLPEGWSSVPPSNSMRLAEVQAPGDPEPCVAAFSTAGGGVEANISRWVMQMTDADGAPLPEPDINTRQVAGLSAHTVELTGTYLGMRMNPPKPDTTMRAAIIETAAGLLFIKMTGPSESMAANADAWNAMLDSAQAG